MPSNLRSCANSGARLHLDSLPACSRHLGQPRADLMFKHSELLLVYLGFRRVQSPPRRANGIVVEEVERHGCRESHGGPWMAHRGGPLERRWSERTLAQPGPDERAEGLVTLPAKSLAREGETKDINKNAAIRNKHPNNQKANTNLPVRSQSTSSQQEKRSPKAPFFTAGRINE
jgi:hypothetical protein